LPKTTLAGGERKKVGSSGKGKGEKRMSYPFTPKEKKGVHWPPLPRAGMNLGKEEKASLPSKERGGHTASPGGRKKEPLLPQGTKNPSLKKKGEQGLPSREGKSPYRGKTSHAGQGVLTEGKGRFTGGGKKKGGRPSRRGKKRK